MAFSLVCQMLQEREAALRENQQLRQKGGEVSSVLGNLLIHIHELGLRKSEGIYGKFHYRNERAEKTEQQFAQKDARIAELTK